jgi:hypothetical protein
LARGNLPGYFFGAPREPLLSLEKRERLYWYFLVLGRGEEEPSKEEWEKKDRIGR